MLKQVEIDASKNESKNTESQIIIRVENRNANEKIEIHNENQYEIIQSEKLDEEYRTKVSESKLGFWKNKILKRSQKNKKIFLDSSPHRQPAEKGEGVYESKI